MRMMKKKIWIILLAALLAMDVLTACTPSTGPDPAKEPTASVEVPAGFELMDISALKIFKKCVSFSGISGCAYTLLISFTWCGSGYYQIEYCVPLPSTIMS